MPTYMSLYVLLKSVFKKLMLKKRVHLINIFCYPVIYRSRGTRVEKQTLVKYFFFSVPKSNNRSGAAIEKYLFLKDSTQKKMCDRKKLIKLTLGT